MPAYKNAFKRPEFHEHVITNADSGRVIGTLRIKPNRVLWKPSGAQKFTSVKLEDFAAWITDPSTRSRQTSS